MLLFSTAAFSYSQEVITCNKITRGGFTVSDEESRAGRAHWNNWYYGNGKSFSYSWPAGNSYSNNSRTHYPNGYVYRPTSPVRNNVSGANYIRYTPRPSCRVSSSGNKLRTFTSKDGGKFEGRLLSISATNKTARIRDKKGLAYNVSIVRFCSSDVSYLKSWWVSRNPPKKLTGYKAFLARRKNG